MTLAVVKLIPAGPYAGQAALVRNLLYSASLAVLQDGEAIETFHFESWTDAVDALDSWDGRGRPQPRGKSHDQTKNP